MGLLFRNFVRWMPTFRTFNGHIIASSRPVGNAGDRPHRVRDTQRGKSQMGLADDTQRRNLDESATSSHALQALQMNLSRAKFALFRTPLSGQLRSYLVDSCLRTLFIGVWRATLWTADVKLTVARFDEIPGSGQLWGVFIATVPTGFRMELYGLGVSLVALFHCSPAVSKSTS